LGSNNLYEIFSNNSSIPMPFKAEVFIKIEPISLANFSPSSSSTCSCSNKSLLFPTNPIAILIKKY